MRSNFANARALRKNRGQRGQATVEFAFASFFVILMLFGIIEFGLALFSWDLVTNAARIGSRWAMVRGSSCPAALSGCPATNASVQTYVLSQSAGINPTLLHVTTTWPSGAAGCPIGGNGPGCVVNVSVSYTFNLLFDHFAPIAMSSASQMYISQ